MTRQSPTTIAILGGNPVVGGFLSLLLGSFGCSIRVLETYPSGVVDDLLDGVDALVRAPGLDDGMREAFLQMNFGESPFHALG